VIRDLRCENARCFYGTKRFINGGILVAERAGYQTRYGVHYERGRQFAAREHKIADREFVGCQMIGDALVNAFVPAAQQDDSIELRESPDRILPE
jgi:hypothetical protein